MKSCCEEFSDVRPVANRSFCRQVQSPVASKFLAPSALVDQTIVSGTNFLTFAVIGRTCGAAELGVYSLAFSLLVFAQVAAQSLVATPYINLLHRRRGDSLARFSGSAVTLAAAVGVSFAAIAVTIGLALEVADKSGLASAFYAVSLAAPFSAVREFIRRYLFSHLHFIGALYLAAIASALQLAAVFGLLVTGNIAASTALLTAAFASAVVSCGYLLIWRRDFRVVRSRLALAARQYWRFGKWVFATEATTPVGSQFFDWLLFATGGMAATGLFAACSAVTNLFNPFFMAATNVSEPILVRGYRDGGIPRLQRQVRAVTILLFVTMLPLCVLIHLRGAAIMALLFGKQYTVSGGTLSILVLALFISMISVPTTFGLRALRRPELAFTSRIAGFIASIAIACALIPLMQTSGAAIAMLAGSILSAAVRANIFSKLCEAAAPEAVPAPRTLGQLDPST